MSRLSSFALLAVLALLGLSAVSAQTCAGAGYDLSALANQQFYYFSGTYNFAISPVSAATPTRIASAAPADVPFTHLLLCSVVYV